MTKLPWLLAALHLSISASSSSAVAAAFTGSTGTANGKRRNQQLSINDHFESVAIATHSAVSKMAREANALSNDDPAFIGLLMSVTINGTTLTQSPSALTTLAPSAVPKAPLMPTTVEATELNSQATLAPTATTTSAMTMSPTTIEEAEAARRSSSPTWPVTTSLAPSLVLTHRPIDASSYPPTSDGAGNGDAMPDTNDGEDANGNASTGSSLNPTTSPSAFLSTKASTSASTSNNPTYSPTDEDTYMQYPTYNPSDGHVPTYLPSAFSTNAPTTPPSSNTVIATDAASNQNATFTSPTNDSHQVHEDGDACPQVFDKSRQYKEGDVVSVKRNRRCLDSDSCHVMFQCKTWPESLYCNSFAPGRRKSGKGWLKLGRCNGSTSVGDSSAPEGNADSTSAQELLSNSPTVSPVAGGTPEDATLLPTNETASSPVHSTPTTAPSLLQHASSVHEPTHSPTFSVSSTKTVPTLHPTTKRQAGQSPMWFKPGSSGDLNSDTLNDTTPNSIAVNLPRIICDITLSANSGNLRTHVLLASMTNIIYDLFDAHLPKTLYDLVGIKLNADVKRNGSNDKDEEAAAPSTFRLHAYFTGTASFSLRGAPSSKDLITLLVTHFDVDEFNSRLSQVPSKVAKARAAAPKSRAEESIEVNAVFFTTEDGSLIQAGSTYTENKLPKTAKGPNIGGQRVQISFVLLALTAMACMLGMIMFVLYSNRMNDDEEDNDGIVIACTDVSPEGQPSMTAEGGGSSDAATKVEVEIELPSTPQITMSDMSEDNSEVSSLSESPFMAAAKRSRSYYGRGLDSTTPSTPGLGIRSYRYVSDCTVGFAGEQSWQHQQQSRNWEIYQDSSMMESP